MRNAFDEFFLRTNQVLPSEPGGYFRSSYDSLIYSFRQHVELMEKMSGCEVNTIHLIGGGSQSRYLAMGTANICGRKVICGPAEAATLGNILVQAIAMGVVTGLTDARKLIKDTMPLKTFFLEKQSDMQLSSYKKFLELITF